MRLTPQQSQTVKTLAHQYFGHDVGLWLFGSRADDNKRGGDYDFLIETALRDGKEIISQKIKLLAALQSSPAFEDEKIDLVIKRRASTFDMPIYHVAKQEGVPL